jgi:alkylation response protein AidB-like acyl-CoA dehydrogenase
MRFTLTDEQLGFAEALDGLLGSSDVPRVARAWADGDLEPGRQLWKRLEDLGVTGLLVDESIPGGVGAEPIDMTIAFEALGYHCVPGPWVETAAYAPILVKALAEFNDALDWDIGAADTVHTVAVPPHVPYALDADFAASTFLVSGITVSLARPQETIASIDRTRRLSRVEAQDPPLADLGSRVLDDAFDLAVLAVSAQLLGCGERLLADAVTYAKQRRQFGREIGSYQAIKHQLADVRIALDFARPLIHGAALTVAGPDGSRDVSSAKVATGDAAYLASRIALQVHGAIGYTAEFDLSLWITKVRALVGAWGTPAYHRGRVLDVLNREVR